MSNQKKRITGDPEIDQVLNDVGEGLQELFGEVKKAGKKAVDDAKKTIADQVPVPPVVDMDAIKKSVQQAAEQVSQVVQDIVTPEDEPEEKVGNEELSLEIGDLIEKMLGGASSEELRDDIAGSIYDELMEDVKPIVDALPGLSKRFGKDMTPALVALVDLIRELIGNEDVRQSVRETNAIDAQVAMERYAAYLDAGFDKDQSFILTAGKEPMARQMMATVSKAVAEAAGKAVTESSGSPKKPRGTSKKSAAGKKGAEKKTSTKTQATVTKRKVRVTTPKGDKKK